MYAIISNGVLVALCERPRYIRDNPETGLFIESTPEEAIGIAVGGDLYNLNGSEAIPDVPDAIVTEAESGEYIFRTAKEVESIGAASGIAFVTLAEVGNIDDVTAGEHTELFELWAYPKAYKTGQLRRHTDGKLYRCLQDHTSQEDWAPDVAVSLWVSVSDPAEEWPEWAQPVGAQDAYAINAQVSHGGKHWTSEVDNNVWEPGVYGWVEANE